MTISEAIILIQQLPPRESALHRATGEAALWSPSDYLLEVVVNLLLAANWQRGNAGARSVSPRPAPFRLPGSVDAVESERGRLAREFLARHGKPSKSEP